MKFRKKPVVINAVQWTGNNLAEVANFVGERITSYERITGLGIHTLEGDMHASVGDWIIQGVQGEFYPCKPDIFEATYEVVNERKLIPEETTQRIDQMRSTLKDPSSITPQDFGVPEQYQDQAQRYANWLVDKSSVTLTAPPGWKLVPEDPTDEMLEAWRCSGNTPSGSYDFETSEDMDDWCNTYNYYAMLKAAPTPPERNHLPIPTEFLEGMSVSVDVSTGNHDEDHRYFGTITEVMEDPDSKHGVTLLVQDAEPNF